MDRTGDFPFPNRLPCIGIQGQDFEVAADIDYPINYHRRRPGRFPQRLGPQNPHPGLLGNVGDVPGQLQVPSDRGPLAAQGVGAELGRGFFEQEDHRVGHEGVIRPGGQAEQSNHCPQENPAAAGELPAPLSGLGLSPNGQTPDTAATIKAAVSRSLVFSPAPGANNGVARTGAFLSYIIQ